MLKPLSQLDFIIHDHLRFGLLLPLGQNADKTQVPQTHCGQTPSSPRKSRYESGAARYEAGAANANTGATKHDAAAASTIACGTCDQVCGMGGMIHRTCVFIEEPTPKNVAYKTQVPYMKTQMKKSIVTGTIWDGCFKGVVMCHQEV